MPKRKVAVVFIWPDGWIPLRIGSWFSGSNPDVMVTNGDMIRSGYAELGSDPFSHVGAAVGHRIPLTRNVSFRHEYGLTKI